MSTKGVIATSIATMTTCSVLGGCAGLEFYPSPRPDTLTYFEPAPYLFVSTTKDCVTTATVVTVPGLPRSVGLHSGYGSADLSVALSNGIITSVGQKTDTKVPETIAAVTGLVSAVPKIAAAEAPKKGIACVTESKLYPIINGIPSNRPVGVYPLKIVRTDDGPAKE